MNAKSSELARWLSTPGAKKSSEGEAESRPSVVIIDDDETVLDALRFALKDEYEIRLCSKPAAWGDVVDEKVDAVVLDIKMAGRDGFWVFREIRRRFEDVPIIFNSAYQDAKDPLEVMNDYRPFGYIVKGEGVHRLLRMVRRAVEYRRGFLQAQRTPSAGITRQPTPSGGVTRPAAPAPVAAARPSNPGSIERPTVLVVDDEPTTLEAMRLALRDDFNIRLTDSAEECLRTLDEADVSAIVLDIKLQGPDGFDVHDEIRKINPLVPVVFYTAHGAAHDPYEVINRCRPFGFLSKNGDAKQVREMLGKAVTHYQRVASNRGVIDKMRSVQKEMQAVVAALRPK